MKLKEILEDYAEAARKTPCLMFIDNNVTDQALTLIKQSLKEAVPKEKKGIKHKEYPMENGSQYSPTDNYKIGFNECRTQTLTTIDTL
jgi:hypothetical protein